MSSKMRELHSLCYLCLALFISSCAGRGSMISGLNVNDFFEGQAKQLATAAAAGNVAKVDKLVAQGVDVNTLGKEGMSPLIWAVAFNNIDGATALLKHGANPNHHADNNGSPITLAAATGAPELLARLIDYGGAPDDSKGIRSALFLALNHERYDNAEMLLTKGADINLTAKDGSNAIINFDTILQYDKVFYLLERGAKYDFAFGLHDNYLPYSIKNSENIINKKSNQYIWYLKIREFLRERGEDL